jgi:hypothetical protein
MDGNFVSLHNLWVCFEIPSIHIFIESPANEQDIEFHKLQGQWQNVLAICPDTELLAAYHSTFSHIYI